MLRPYRLMGILNVTPDSFSDGGRFLDTDVAVAHARALIDEGAEIIDVGGESTRPGAEPVSGEQELRRVLPVLEGIAALDWGGDDARTRAAPVPVISIDTSKAAVARAALAAGAALVNDVSALRADPDMVEVVAASGAQCCLMHMLGEPRTMQADPRYEDVVDEVKAFLEERLEFAVREGVAEERILLDPGIGFGKTGEHNLTLLRRLDELCALGRPLVVGTSRKSFLGRILAASSPKGDAAGEPQPVAPVQRLAGTIASNVLALERGASVFRVHDVAAVGGALAVAAATLGEWPARGKTQTS
ncbi:MAG TPA: dihydropteroate synthase [Solirubrobacteraceae bacterium]|nr:dihydropteroate synthase [Solirubrobacteraceae bacterium]